MEGLDIGGMINSLLPMLDYYITLFTKILTNFAASLGFDLDLVPETPEDPAETPEAVQ